MERRKKLAGFSRSEPDFLISCMNRRRDWAVIVCLVGGGQEINTGEAGIGLWLESMLDHYRDWDMHISPRLPEIQAFLSDHPAARAALWARVKNSPRVHFDPDLHLAVSLRSFRAEKLSAFIDALLALDEAGARDACASLAGRYPIALTRDLDLAKAWIRAHARASDRFGMVASSKAYRLKPLAVDVRVDVDPVHWFLDSRADTRSSFYLEDAATEFQVQGLELDWVCVSWDGDLRCAGDHWAHHRFRGDRWCCIHNLDDRKFQLNAYRVLLTRARQGMVIFVPEGDTTALDPTRSPKYYDTTFGYLRALGLPVLG